MNRVIIEKESILKIEKDIIIIDGKRYPLRLIDTLFISSKVDISIKDLSKISKKDINIILISYNPKEFIHIQKIYQKNGDLKLSQYKALENRVEIAKHIVSSKIIFSKKTLEKFDKEIDEKSYLQNLKKSSAIDEILGIEGSFSREYFKRYFSIFPKILAKGTRSKQPPLDPVNAMLSFLYTIFYYEISSKLQILGYEPAIGYLHTPFRNHLALSSDILEFFRSRIDEFVAKLFLEKRLTQKDFFKKNGIFLKPTSRKELWKEIKSFLEEQENQINIHISELKKIIEKSSSNQKIL